MVFSKLDDYNPLDKEEIEFCNQNPIEDFEREGVIFPNSINLPAALRLPSLTRGYH